jgi:hypothetical protein
MARHYLPYPTLSATDSGGSQDALARSDATHLDGFSASIRGVIQVRPVLGGLHHTYQRVA